MGARCPGTGDKDPVEHQRAVAMGKCRTVSCSALNHYGCAHQPSKFPHLGDSTQLAKTVSRLPLVCAVGKMRIKSLWLL